MVWYTACGVDPLILIWLLGPLILYVPWAHPYLYDTFICWPIHIIWSQFAELDAQAVGSLPVWAYAAWNETIIPSLRAFYGALDDPLDGDADIFEDALQSILDHLCAEECYTIIRPGLGVTAQDCKVFTVVSFFY